MNYNQILEADKALKVLGWALRKAKAEEKRKRLNKVAKTLPKRMRCPSCGKRRRSSMFGLRICRWQTDDRVKHERVHRQSYCKSCRAQ
jgi:transcription elongation factor Elf1